MAEKTHAMMKKENTYLLDLVSKTHNSITIRWDEVEDPLVDCFEVRYREKKGETEKKSWKVKSTDGIQTNITVDDLKADRMYEFRLVGLYDGDFVFSSKTPSEFNTKYSLASYLQKDMQLYQQQKLPSGIAIYQFNTRVTNIADGIRKCEIMVNRKQDADQEDKTILMVGETGAGKSSFIDAFINNVTGVSWNDDFRFKLISLTEEEKTKQNKKILSQTESVTWYRIPPIAETPLHYFLNIIDTPGFGDTSGLQKDKQIITLLQLFFKQYSDSGTSKVSAICFVVKSDSERLTVQQTYIFECLTLIFGKDIRQNICIIATHADTGVPRVLKTLGKLGIPIELSCQFDNKPLEEWFGKGAELAQEICNQNFQRFVNLLDTIKPCRIDTTIEIIHQREHLDVILQNLLQKVEESVIKVIACRLQYRMINEYKLKKMHNVNYKYYIPIMESRERTCDDESRAVSCKNCMMTCHYPCDIKHRNLIWWCSAMDRLWGNCKVCPSKCFWSFHVTKKEYIEQKQGTKEVTMQETLKLFTQADKGVQQHGKLSIEVFEEVRQAFAIIGNLIKNIDECLKSINEHSTKEVSLLGYLNILIERQTGALAIGNDDRKYVLLKIKDAIEKSNIKGCEDFTEVLKKDTFIRAVITEGI